ncbi:TnsD family Tn7-like transposition protein [Deinococcus planocerae]|uniref:TnsD family Tn7-like transposition protein n=1 Tax=Deinococcus planocerae TaxID=1737569 RepID=UPI0015E09343|nr:TnsD family Tn7-like transposition protein [Deinococcus planocerae]
MVALFPSPYEDELLYSLCARYARLMGYGNLKTTLWHLFGRETITAVMDLPTHLGHLAGQLADIGGPGVEELIDQHTLLPYFAAFHLPERREEVRAAMRGDGHPHWRLGLMASRVAAARALRFCPSCVTEERTRHGEAYWHRAHQLPGVLVCERHAVWLEESEVVLPAPVTRHVFIPAETVIPQNLFARQVPEGCERDVLLDLARRALGVMVGPPPAVLPSALRDGYLAALAERQLATFSGQAHIEEVRAALRTVFPAEVMERIGLPPEDDGWWLRLLRKPRVAAHTLHHLLMQAFLGLHRERLGTTPPPFGSGPWPCLNAASAHHGEPRIERVQVNYTCNAREPIGTFTCSCGFAYRRVGPDRTPQDARRLDRVAAYGPVWEFALRKFWLDPALSLRELSRRLGFDPGTVRQQAARLGLPPQRPGSRGAKPPREKIDVPGTTAWNWRREECRAAWQQQREEKPEASTSGLRRLIPGVYIWLYRHDRNWLTRNKPLRTTPRPSIPRVDWGRRDTRLARELRRAAQDLLRLERPIRVTPGRLGREVGQAALLEQHLGRLPRCARVLAEVSETREAFAVRRIRRAAAGLQQMGGRIPRWHFARLCGLRPELLAVPEVAQAFEQAWAALLTRFEVPAA